MRKIDARSRHHRQHISWPESWINGVNPLDGLGGLLGGHAPARQRRAGAAGVGDRRERVRPAQEVASPASAALTTASSTTPPAGMEKLSRLSEEDEYNN